MTDAESSAGRWLRDRLTGDAAHADWRRLLEAGWTHLLTVPLGELLPPQAVIAWAEAHLDPDTLEALLRPICGAGLRETIEQMQADQAPVGRWVPSEARALLERVVARPGFVHEDWVRTTFREKAIEEVLSDTLYRALRDFSTVLPRLVLRVLPSVRLPGLGRSKGSLAERVAGQLESLIEPEIKAFLAGGSQKALDRAAQFAIERLDAPTTVEMRRNIIGFILDQSPAFHAQALDETALADLDQAARRIARQVAESPETAERVSEWVRRTHVAWGERPLGEVLEALGYQAEPPFDAISDVTWPLVRSFVDTPEVDRWLNTLAAGIVQAAQVDPPQGG